MSCFSLLEGTTLPEDLLDTAVDCEYDRFALTDINNLYAAPAFYSEAVSRGIAPILGSDLRRGPCRVIAFVRDESSYEDLCRIITCIHKTDTSLPEILLKHGHTLHLIAMDPETARTLCSAGVCRERLWLSLESTLDSGCVDTYGLPLVAVGSVSMCCPDDIKTARLLAARRLHIHYREVSESILPSPRECLVNHDELVERYIRYPDSVRNNSVIAEDCSSFQLLPRKPILPKYDAPGEGSSTEYLSDLCQQGIASRYGDTPSAEVRERLEYEMKIITRLGFVDYFLVVWDIVRYARERGAPVAGRGSGASSLVAYLLRITNVCPLQYNIPFERFLHENRSDCPDLDIDFCWRIRDEVIDYIFRRWGRENVAMVSMHCRFKESSAMRETLKAFGYADSKISKLSEKQLKEDPEYKDIVWLAQRIAGLPRNLSVHPGGIVIGHKPISSYVPVQGSPKGVDITQFDKQGIEAIGLVKIDILGNRSLSTVRYACDLISERQHKTIDIEKLPISDKATISKLQAGDTVGCNQLESPALRHLLKMIQPRDTNDVMKTLALIRPGAASIGMKRAFVRRNRGLDPIPKGNAGVDAILASTNGVMTFEDDVMLVASELLGTTLSESDGFRRAVQKCSGDEERLRLSQTFLRRCQATGISLDYAKSIWVQMAKFNEYSFCRAHAASYGVLSYASVWLKTHYPLEFWTSALNNNQSMYHPRVYVESCKRDHISFLLPDINSSQLDFRIENGSIRIGLKMVKGLGEISIKTILECRRTAPFKGVTDFIIRTGLPFKSISALILCGSFDSTGIPRHSAIQELEEYYRSEKKWKKELSSDTSGDYPWHKKYLDEWRILGICVRKHIMSLFRDRLQSQVSCDSRNMQRFIGQSISIAGMLETRQRVTTPDGKDLIFATFDDEYGLFEVNISPTVYQEPSHSMASYGPYVIHGRIKEECGAVSIDAESFELDAIKMAI